MSTPIEYLQENGPSTIDELPVDTITPQHRMDGATKFKLQNSSGRGGDSSSWGGPTDPVYYLFGEHDEEAVIRKWLDVNDHVLEHKSKRALTELFGDQGSSWKDTARPIVHERIEDATNN